MLNVQLVYAKFVSFGWTKAWKRGRNMLIRFEHALLFQQKGQVNEYV